MKHEGFQKWRLTKDGYIKRYKTNNLGSENYPRKKYASLNEKEKLDLIDKLNFVNEEKAKKKFILDHSFITKEMLADYKAYISSAHANDYTTDNTYNAFIKHGLFLLQDNFGPNPVDWKKNESTWGELLIKKSLSKSTIKSVVHNLNRFFKFTHQKHPEKISELEFQPIGKHQFRQLESKRLSKILKSGKRDPRGIYIEKSDLKVIFKSPPPDIYPHLRLMFLYGVRVGEACALPCDYKKRVTRTHLLIDREFDSIGEAVSFSQISTKPVKYNKPRNVPHRFRGVDLKELQELLESMTPMHVDTVKHKISEYMQTLNLSIDTHYTSHDFRRTFITDAFDNGFIATDIMDAAGHSDLKTTLGYRRKKDDSDNELVFN